jgi:hypothetical protein
MYEHGSPNALEGRTRKAGYVRSRCNQAQSRYGALFDTAGAHGVYAY